MLLPSIFDPSGFVCQCFHPISCFSDPQGTALYMPAGWIFAERVVGPTSWIGIKAGAISVSLKTLSDMNWLKRSWCKDDEVCKLAHATMCASWEAMTGQREDAKEAGVNL